MTFSGIRGRTLGMGWKLALLTVLIPTAAWGQDCDVDADCGHGFQCIHTSGSAVTGGVGGSQSQAECGDSICDFAAEDIESCPQDCDTLQYCAPAECDSDSDCAEGYECGEESGSGTSGFTSAGGSSASVCGDGVCDLDETNGNCAADCAVVRSCREQQVQCMSDGDCDDGFYCYVGEVAEASSVAVSSVGSTGGADDTVSSSDDSGSDGSDGSSATTDSGFAPPADTGGSTSGGDEVGVCLPESSDSGSTGDVGTTGDDTDAGSATTEGEGATSDGAATGPSAGNGAGGVSSTLGSGSPASATGGDSDASASDGSGSGGADPDAGGDDADESDGDEGCSCAVVGTKGASGLFAALLLGLVVSVRRRRSSSQF